MRLVLVELVSLFKSRARLEAEHNALRHQLIVLRRKIPCRARLTNTDRLVLVWLSRLFPSILSVIQFIQLETIIRWYRAGFRTYWRWKSGTSGGHPRIDPDVRNRIRQMNLENPLWGAPRIQGELLRVRLRIGIPNGLGM